MSLCEFHKDIRQLTPIQNEHAIIMYIYIYIYIYICLCVTVRCFGLCRVVSCRIELSKTHKMCCCRLTLIYVAMLTNYADATRMSAEITVLYRHSGGTD